MRDELRSVLYIHDHNTVVGPYGNVFLCVHDVFTKCL